MGTVKDRVILITGASGGIGSATARLAADSGLRVVLAGRRKEPLERLAAELGGEERALPVPCDTTSPADVRRLAARAEGVFGGIDVVFANAGTVVRSSFLSGAGGTAGDEESADLDEWRDAVLTNVYGTAVTARLLLPALVRSRGHLLLTGSVVGRIVVPGDMYSVTKWAVTAMGEAVRAEVEGRGVRVTVLQPGLVDTPLVSPERRSRPMLRPEDVARTVLAVASQPPGVDINEVVMRPLAPAEPGA